MKIFNKENRALFGLSLGHFSVDLYASLLVPLYPFIVSKLDINLATISSTIALGHLVSSMMQPIFGFVADKLKHRFFMVWGLILSSIFIPFSIKANSLLFFTMCLLLGMVGNAFFHPQVSALIKEFNKNNPKITFIMGVFLGIGTLGYAIGPYVSSFTVNHFGQNALLFLSAIGLFSAVFMYFFVPKKPKTQIQNQDNFFFIIKEILKNKCCMFLTFVSIIKSAVSISFGTYIPFLLKSHGFSLPTIGLIVTGYFVMGGFATIYSSKFENKIGSKGVITLSFVTILPLILLFLYFINTNKIIAISAFILTGFFIMLSVGILLVQGQNAMPKYTGVISGVMQGFSWGIGALFLSPLGFLGQQFGIDKILILMSSLALLTGIYSYKSKYLK